MANGPNIVQMLLVIIIIIIIFISFTLFILMIYVIYGTFMAGTQVGNLMLEVEPICTG